MECSPPSAIKRVLGQPAHPLLEPVVKCLLRQSVPVRRHQHTELEVLGGTPAHILLEEFQLLAGGQDRLRPLAGTGFVGHGLLIGDWENQHVRLFKRKILQ